MKKASALRCAVLSLFLVLAATLLAHAANTTSSVTVHVTDAAGKPLWLARATIYDKRALIALSNQSGDAIFPSVPAGSYKLQVVRYGYETFLLDNIALHSGRVSLNVKMAKSFLRQIANVTAKAPRASTETLRQDSPSAEISNSLVTALQTVPGVSLTPNGQVSIRGYSPAQTAVTINGVPVSLPGSSETLQMFNADLFSSASVTPQPGGGGTVDFETQSPTLAWQGVARAVLSQHGGEDLALQESGTAGQLGVSFTHASNTLSNPLDGLSYLDTSGLFYAHRAANVVSAEAFQTRYQSSPYNTIIGNVVSMDATFPLICTVWTGVLPCGYGPGNLRQMLLQTYQLKDFAQIGHSSVAVTAYTNRFRDNLNQSGYYVNGIPLPTESLANSHQSGAIASTHIRVGGLILPLNLSTASTVTVSQGAAFGTLLPTYLAHYSSQSASTSLPLISTRRLDAHIDLGFQNNDVGNVKSSKTSTGFDLTYELSNGDKTTASLTMGALGTPQAGFTGVSSPELLQFNCSGNLAFGIGPASATAGGSQTQASLSWAHSAARWSSEVNAYHNVQYNGQIQGMIAGTSLPAALFSPSYLSTAQEAQRTACGQTQPLDLSHLYFTVKGIANTAVYEGVDASATYDLSQDTNVTANYATTVAYATGNDPLLFGPGSTIIAHHQLPNVPLHGASVTLKTLISNRIVGLFQTNYSSANNSFNLPAYVSLNAGALVSMPRGLLSISVTNLGNVYPGPFATATNAVPLATNGGMLAIIASPLSPRTIAIGYRFQLGQPESSVSFSIPAEQFQPVMASGLAIQIPGVIPFLNRPPPNPFEIDREKTSCGPRDVQSAQSVLSACSAYANRIELSKIGTEYPEEFPPMDDGAIQFNYNKTGSSYVIFITIAASETVEDFLAQFQPAQNCAAIHGGAEQELLFHHLYNYPVDTPRMLSVLPLYSPEVGIYHEAYALSSPVSKVPVPQNLNGAGKSDSGPPSAAFTLNDSGSCSAEVRPAAADFLHAVQQYAHAYFDLHKKPSNPKGLLIVPHANGAKSWISIRTEDLQSLDVLEQCINVLPATHAALQAHGFDGAPRPQLNYTPLLGFYLSR